jgi:hypothetical protein
MPWLMFATVNERPELVVDDSTVPLDAPRARVRRSSSLESFTRRSVAAGRRPSSSGRFRGGALREAASTSR